MNDIKHAKREQIYRLAAEHGVKITQLENGLFHIHGRFIDMKVRDLAVVSPRELAKVSWPRTGKGERARAF